MNTHATLEQMKELRLTGMAHSYQQQLDLPVHQQLDAHELIALLLQAELSCRQQEKTTYYLKLAKLRMQAIPEQIHCSAARNLSKKQLVTLMGGQNLRTGENILITGAAGCGKSYLAVWPEDGILQHEPVY
jgi:DNA replication protein DnaC